MIAFCRTLLILVCAIYTCRAQSQYQLGDLDLDGNIAAWYDLTNGIRNYELFEGVYVPIETRSPFSHQFFGENNWTVGSIVFAGKTFSNVQMLYDINQDFLIVRNLNPTDPSSQSLKINQDKIESFTLQNTFFRNIQTGKHSTLKSGIYEVIYEGEIAGVFVKRIKDDKVMDDGFERGIYYYEKNRYFLVRGDSYFPYRGKNTFFQAFREFKPQIKAFVKRNGLILKKGNDAHIKSLIEYCEELISN